MVYEFISRNQQLSKNYLVQSHGNALKLLQGLDFLTAVNEKVSKFLYDIDFVLRFIKSFQLEKNHLEYEVD